MTQLICWFVLVNFEHIQHIFFSTLVLPLNFYLPFVILISAIIYPFFCTNQILAKKMIANGKGGSIVNVSSQASMIALPLHTAYCKFIFKLLRLSDNQ